MNQIISNSDPHATGHFLPEPFNKMNSIVTSSDTSNDEYIVRYDGDGLALSIPEEVLLAPDGSWCQNFPVSTDYLDLGMLVADAINCVFRDHFVVDKQLAYRFLQERAFTCGYGWVGPFECADWSHVRPMSLGETFREAKLS